MDLRDELLALVDRLAADGIEYAVCGGIALAIHGFPRFTKDIDVLIRGEDADRAVAAAADLGYTLDAGIIPFDTGKPEAREVRRISKIEGDATLTLDLLLVSPILESVFSARAAFEWEGRRLQVVTREGLAFMKRLAGRDQDLLDAKRLEALDDDDEAQS